MWEKIDKKEYLDIYRKKIFRPVSGGQMSTGGFFTEWAEHNTYSTLRFERGPDGSERFYKWQLSTTFRR